MPPSLMSKPDLLARLMELFRDKGFDGASLAAISESTGLGKSSLYHHFPNGKEEMALEVLAHLDAQLERAVFEPLRAAGTPRKKLDRMLDAIDDHHLNLPAGGTQLQSELFLERGEERRSACARR